MPDLTAAELAELKQKREAAIAAIRPNDNSYGDWKAKQHGEGPEWIICGPKYATRESRAIVAVTELDGFTGEHAVQCNRDVAEYLVSAVNALPKLLAEVEKGREREKVTPPSPCDTSPIPRPAASRAPDPSPAGSPRSPPVP